MLLFFRKDFDFESIENDRLHKIALPKDRVGKLIKLTHMLLKNDGAGKIERLTKLMQYGHPFL